MPTINRTEVDGIPTFWVDGPRPFTAALIFRVGLFDETMRERGITHLVEHLAMSGVRDVEVDMNAFVDDHLTAFWGWGEPGRVGRYLSRLCSSLHDLPVGRLETESSVLTQEASLRAPNYSDSFLWAYYGPFGPGTAGTREFGLSWLGGSELGDWAARYFNLSNAALVIVGKPPSDWKLDLPNGAHRPPPVYERLRPAPDNPTLYENATGGVSWGALVRDDRRDPHPGVQLAHELFVRRLEDRMRHELGHAYAVTPMGRRTDTEHLFIAHGFECAPDRSRAAFVEHNRVMEQFIEEGPKIDEIKALRRILVAHTEDHPNDFATSLAWDHAQDHLNGWGPTLSYADWIDSLTAVQPGEIAQRFAEVYRQSYTAGNSEDSDDLLPMDAQVRYEREPLPGLKFQVKPFRRAEISAVVVGSDGLSFAERDGWVNIKTHEIALVGPSEDQCKVASTIGVTSLSDDLYARARWRGDVLWEAPGSKAWNRGRIALSTAIVHQLPHEKLLPPPRSAPTDES